jgi:anaerobic magnesium-protoporphyrin IX monomethyl ester cyclase
MYKGSNHGEFLGVGYLAAALQQDNHKTRILDEDAAYHVAAKMGASAPEDWAAQWVERQLVDFGPDLVGVSISTANYENGLKLLRRVRRLLPSTLTVVGGPHITTCWKSFRSSHHDLFDFGVVQEGETAMRDIATKYCRGQALTGISGVFSSSGDSAPYRPVLHRDLDDVPFPDREGFLSPWPSEQRDLAKEHYVRGFYRFLPGFRLGGIARIVATRGCQHKCSFCSPSILWQDLRTGESALRLRKASSVASEIDLLRSQGARAIYFDDPMFPLISRREYASQLLSRYIGMSKQLAFGIVTHADELDAQAIEMLARAGVTYMYFGLEAHEPKWASVLGKRLPLDHAFSVLRLCEKAGIHCDVSYQLGLPGERRDDVSRQIDWLARNFPRRNVFFSLAAVWPGTIWAANSGIGDQDYEPERRAGAANRTGLYFFPNEGLEVEQYFSNCSGAFHFVSAKDALSIKYELIDHGFCRRFDRPELNKQPDEARTVDHESA